MIGDAGSGKTTLLNQLAQEFCANNKTVVLLISKPQFRDLQQFLITIAGIFKTVKAPSFFDDDTFQKAFNSFFYKLFLQEKKTVLLLIDNGHDLPDFCLHALSSFYSHHPDCRHFLQTVISGEPSFQRKINANETLKSRVAYTTSPKPFRFTDVRKLIHFHLEHAAVDPGSPPALFSIPAQWAIYMLTQGHPQKTIDLCHFLVLTLVIDNRKQADWFMTLRAAKLLVPQRAKKLQMIRTTFLSSIIVLMMFFGIWSEEIKTLNMSKPGQLHQANVAQKGDQAGEIPFNQLQVRQKTTQTEQVQETQSKKTAVIKETLPYGTPAEGQNAGMAAAKNSPESPDQPGGKASTVKFPVPESAAVVDEEVTSSPKPVPEIETNEEVEPLVAATAPESQFVTKSVKEQQPVDSPDFIAKRVEPPEYLGDIITASGETFGDMIRRIYGPWSFNPTNVKTVMAANPNLRNPESLFVGYKIRFPTIPVALTPKAEEVWWVRITILGNIQSAYRFLRKYRKSLPPLLIIPSRDDNGQIIMNILLEEYFVDNESAQKAIQALPRAITAQGKVLHGLNPATFYYRLKQND
ncbi:MAG: AAA family ATPase [Deltaproteobacteria bacterium]|nr:AAA family ATPase [Deltaproteobacteria bacterium]